jgi:hypothetical protein
MIPPEQSGAPKRRGAFLSADSSDRQWETAAPPATPPATLPASALKRRSRPRRKLILRPRQHPLRPRAGRPGARVVAKTRFRTRFGRSTAFPRSKKLPPHKTFVPTSGPPPPEILPAPPRPFRKISAEDRLTLPPPHPGVAHPPPSAHPSRTSWVRPNFPCCRSSSTASIRHPFGPHFSGSTSCFNKLPGMAPKGEAR